jgi:hypothetical protein
MRLEQELMCEQYDAGRNYVVVDLNYLSATSLYTTPLMPMGGIDGMRGMSRPLMPRDSRPLTIRPFPESGFQLHIHEGEGGSAHLVTKDRKFKFSLTSFDAAMADLDADKLDIARIFRMPSRRRSDDD